jgi:sulfatase modifying factor 1
MDNLILKDKYKFNEFEKIFLYQIEAEWEFAARGGTKSQGYKYSVRNTIGSVAWYTENSGSKTHPVGQKSPNELGLYDMSGNVWEWCSDWYGENYYSNSPSSNPRGPTSGSLRVLRGGGWGDYAQWWRSAFRNGAAPDDRYSDLGFRLSLSSP